MCAGVITDIPHAPRICEITTQISSVPKYGANSELQLPRQWKVSFTEQDLADTNAELIHRTHGTPRHRSLSWRHGIGGLIQQSDGSGGVLSDEVIAATYEVLKDQVGPVTNNTAVNGAVYDWLNLAAGMTSILSAALGPADLPRCRRGGGYQWRALDRFSVWALGAASASGHSSKL